eukprot:scaffold795_cov187-Amphora_coffeaeformis.AAC.25
MPWVKARNTDDGQCVNYYAKLKLLEQSGNRSAEDVEKEKKILLSFLMALELDSSRRGDDQDEDDDDTFSIMTDDKFPAKCSGGANEYTDVTSQDVDGTQLAMRLAVPKGFFCGPGRNILTVSKRLCIGWMECLYLREFLGKEKFHKLLIAHGLCDNGAQTIAPIEMEYQCDGVPKAGKYPARPCPHVDDAPQTTCLGMKSIKDHLWSGMYMCLNCQRRMPQRELATLERKEGRGDVLTVHQKARLESLRRRAQKHSQRNKIVGAPPQQRAIVRSRVRKGNQKRHGKRKGDTSTTGGGYNRFRRKIPRYPVGLIHKMTEAIRIFIGLLGQESIALTMLNRVCDKVLLRDWQEHGIKEPEFQVFFFCFIQQQPSFFIYYRYLVYTFHIICRHKSHTS